MTETVRVSRIGTDDRTLTVSTIKLGPNRYDTVVFDDSDDRRHTGNTVGRWVIDKSNVRSDTREEALAGEGRIVRAFYRGYHSGSERRAGQVRRLHIMREDGKHPGRQALCGTGGYDVTHSETVLIDPLPASPPAGLTWCPSCVGKAAERTGQLDVWASQLAA